MRRFAILLLVVALAIGLYLAVRAVAPQTSQEWTPAAGPTRPELRAELVAMAEQDQQERTGSDLPPGTKLGPTQDYTRMARLRDIVGETGWPTVELVGADGAQAAWLIAQHADMDVAFQERALELMSAAAERGQADGSQAAYLADRVAVNRGRPQTYGSQIRCRAGEPAPATPIEDEPGVDARRRAAGISQTLAEYYASLAMMCADEAAEGASPAP